MIEDTFELDTETKLTDKIGRWKLQTHEFKSKNLI